MEGAETVDPIATEAGGETPAVTEEISEEISEETVEALPEGEKEPVDEGEPGGSSPEAVFARKNYRARRQAEQAAQQEREARIAAEARLKAIEEQAVQRASQVQPKPQRRWTTAEVLQAKNTPGGITEEQALEYILETKRLAERQLARQEQVKQQQFVRAKTELEKYFEVDPGLRTTTHARANELSKHYADLVQLGLPRNYATMLVAYRDVLGSADKFRQAKESKEMTRQTRDVHVERSGGGDKESTRNTNPLARVPAHFIEHWKSRGYTRDEMIKEAKYIPADRLKPR